MTCYLCLGRRKSAEEKVTGTYKTFVNAWRRHVGNAILPSTRRAIDRDWYRWHNWCDFALNAGVIVNPYRPCVESYCAFLDFYLTLFKPDTVRKYIKNINTAAVERSGYHINTHIPKLIVQRTFRSAAKRLGHAVPGTRLPLTLDILIQIKPFFNFQLHDDRMLWAILCVGIFTLARIGELVPGHDSKLKVDLNGLSMEGDRGTLRLVGTKTDHERKGVELVFFRNNSKCCPFTAMVAFLSGRPSTARSAPLFVDAFARRIAQTWVISRLRTKLQAAGLRANLFSGISLRKGGAQMLLRLEANDKVIMGMGRWMSSCFNRYLRVDDVVVKEWQIKMASLYS